MTKMYNIKRCSELITESSLSPMSMCLDYKSKFKSIETKYRDKLLNFIISILNKYLEYDVDGDGGVVELSDTIELEKIKISHIEVKYIIYADDKWCVEGDLYDIYSNNIEITVSISDLNTLSLCDLLINILDNNDIVKYFVYDAMKKIND